MFGKASKPQNRIDSLIGGTTRIEGNVFFSGGLRVDGIVRGNVSALPDQPGTLVISEHARVDGEVQVAHLVVNGTINGSVHAAETRSEEHTSELQSCFDLVCRLLLEKKKKKTTKNK